jgi:nitroreductase
LDAWTEHGLAAVDTALMAQNVLLAAESVGLGGVFIGGIRDNPQAFEIARLQNGYSAFRPEQPDAPDHRFRLGGDQFLKLRMP